MALAALVPAPQGGPVAPIILGAASGLSPIPSFTGGSAWPAALRRRLGAGGSHLRGGARGGTAKVRVRAARRQPGVGRRNVGGPGCGGRHGPGRRRAHDHPADRLRGAASLPPSRPPSSPTKPSTWREATWPRTPSWRWSSAFAGSTRSSILPPAGVRFDQELACDAAVIAKRPGLRRPYAEALLKTQVVAAIPPVGCAWRARGFQALKDRIRLLKQRAPSAPRRVCGGPAARRPDAWRRLRGMGGSGAAGPGRHPSGLVEPAERLRPCPPLSPQGARPAAGRHGRHAMPRRPDRLAFRLRGLERDAAGRRVRRRRPSDGAAVPDEADERGRKARRRRGRENSDQVPGVSHGRRPAVMLPADPPAISAAAPADKPADVVVISRDTRSDLLVSARHAAGPVQGRPDRGRPVAPGGVRDEHPDPCPKRDTAQYGDAALVLRAVSPASAVFHVDDRPVQLHRGRRCRPCLKPFPARRRARLRPPTAARLSQTRRRRRLAQPFRSRSAPGRHGSLERSGA